MKYDLARLGDVCEIISGSTPKTNIPAYWNGDQKWITPAELGNGIFIISDSIRHISKEAVKNTGLRLLPTGTVILSSRAPIGKTAIAGCPLYCNQGFKNLVCSQKINNIYLYFFLSGQTAYLNSLGRGATFKEISKTVVAEIQIPLPSIQKQKEIATKFLQLRALITARTKQLALLDRLASSRFIEMFGDPDSNEKHWAVCSVKDCVKSIQNGKSPICKNYPRIGNSPGVLKLSSISSGNFRPSENKAMRAEIPFLQEYEVCSGDLLLSRKNTYELVGMACYVFQTPSMLQLPDLIFRLQVQKKVHGIYLWRLLNYPTFRSRIQSLAGGSAGSMPNISKQRLEKLMIPLPPLSLQTEFAAFIEQLDKSKLADQTDGVAA